jgi:hypothetical protein
MSSAFRRRISTFVIAAVMSVAVPAGALANQGGVPHNAKPCKNLPTQSKSHDNKPKKAHKANNGKSKGKKCGFKKGR